MGTMNCAVELGGAGKQNSIPSMQSFESQSPCYEFVEVGRIASFLGHES